MKQDIEYAVPLFKAGAEWRINSVWHNDWRSEYEWVKSCYYNKILRWAYIKDLLP